MINRTGKRHPDLLKPQVLIRAMTNLLILMINVGMAVAQDTTSTDLKHSLPVTAITTREYSGCKITNNGYGGPVIKLSRLNDQFAFMTGGRGAVTINNRYTIGGGGYGIANSINIPGSGEDTTRLFKMGYGGVELGYILLPGKKVSVGTSLLIAGGASFWQNKPKSNSEKILDNDFSIFPVLEPSLYVEITLTRFLRLHTGISYRYVNRSHSDYIPDQKIRGFSLYVGLLFGDF